MAAERATGGRAATSIDGDLREASNSKYKFYRQNRHDVDEEGIFCTVEFV